MKECSLAGAPRCERRVVHGKELEGSLNVMGSMFSLAVQQIIWSAAIDLFDVRLKLFLSLILCH